MPNRLKAEELGSYRESLLGLQARLRGDLDQMTDEALRRDQPESSGNLSNVPLHMADVGTENYDQEFTLSLIENEQDDARADPRRPGTDRRGGPSAGARSAARADRQAPTASPALYEALHPVRPESWRAGE